MWEQIAANRRRSALLITGMAVVLVLLGFTAGLGLGGVNGASVGILIALVIWFLQMLAYWTNAESILLAGTGAQELKREDSPRLFNIVDEMCIASGLGYTPKIYLMDDPAPNACAVGRKPTACAICVTSGLLHRLDRDELQGVIAHEISHLKNRDVQFMTLAAILLGSIVILSELTWRVFSNSGRGRSRSDSRGGGQAQLIYMVVALLLAVLGPLMAQLLYFACSRKREFLADACAAQYTRYPEGLASALEKISQARVETTIASKATAPLYIVNPLYAHEDEPDGVFASHPPTTERIKILRSMTGASLADYQTAYKNIAGGNLMGAASLQESAAQPARAGSDEGPIGSRRDVRSMVYRTNGYLHLKCNCGMEMNVPENFERNVVVCVRCGSKLPIPAVKAEEAPPASPTMPPLIPVVTSPLQYTRTGSGWESFRCSCGRTVQISPAFEGKHLQCGNCHRQIDVE